MRTFVAVADQGQFQEAAAELGVTQQAVSKRIASLEAELGVRLFTRTPKGAHLTVDGQAFLPHARAVLDAVRHAAESVRSGRRSLRVDVIGRRIAPAALLQDFHRRHPGTALDVVTLLDDEEAAVEAVRAGTVDASFRTLRTPRRQLPGGVRAVRVLDEPLELVTGPAHPLAAAGRVAPADLPGHRIWIPGIVPGTEWAAYYAELAAAFGLDIDATGPNFGLDHLLDVVGGSSSLCTFVGARTLVPWPARPDLRRIPLVGPTPVYPHALIWRTDNAHPALGLLRDHLLGGRIRPGGEGVWTPSWA